VKLHDLIEHEETKPRSRRALLAGALGGIGAWAASAVGRVDVKRTAAAVGDPVRAGMNTTAGSATTTVTNSSDDATLKAVNNGKGPALYGDADGGNGGFTRTRGANKHGLIAINGSDNSGSGAAIRATGNANDAIVATTETSSKYAVHGTNSSASGHGVRGNATGGFGVYGTSSSSIGVRGTSTSSYGVSGFSSSNYGVLGSSSTGDGVAGLANSAGAHGVRGTQPSTSGSGVYGVATNSANDTSGVGVHGESSGDGGFIFIVPIPAAGVRGTQVGSGAKGLAAGVWGEASSADGYGVYGIAYGDGDGVVGNAFGGTGLAGSFFGNAAVTGSLSKGGGSFKIDHPLDPANKFLQHSFVESPDMMNVYNGNVTTDAKGLATVSLPDWFGSLNADFRYQLTAIGTFAQAMIKSEIKDNQFVIQTDQPRVKVSWQVTGIRQDVWAEKNRIEVEVAKTGNEKGKYLHPVEHGRKDEEGIAYRKGWRSKRPA
jgi:hypothetical protein